ncbi:MAG: hypothetical protein A2289_08625 [Deltaproteobacteria bacterium RIFOXYA12_FULL_58_15]|nr:MAG: hypothetical protein A2289_08625 [Deltaproteobacteria bacterium RIFOXYA12_FULL_58_15]OGR10294.1 MAG: hypothetical protein A2341_16855 [Deltaproteobacteria bacterium RIFOXYB12_FULL_58_9]
MADPIDLAACIDSLNCGVSPQKLWDSWGARSVKTRSSQRVFDVGDPADDAYLLLDGLLAVTTAGDKPQVLLILRSPVLWGDIELVAGDELRATALRSVGEARMLCFDADDLLQAREQLSFLRWHEQDLAKRLARILANGSIGVRTLEQRVAAVLDALELGAHEIDPTQLALMTGASIKAVQRTLRQLEEFGRKSAPLRQPTTMVYGM